MKAEKTIQKTLESNKYDLILVKIDGTNYQKHLTINQNLMITNLKAIVEYELQQTITLSINKKQLPNESLIKDVLRSNDTITI